MVSLTMDLLLSLVMKISLKKLSGSFPGPVQTMDLTGSLISRLKIFKNAATWELEITWISGLNLDRSYIVLVKKPFGSGPTEPY
jgi:hypothetical protein